MTRTTLDAWRVVAAVLAAVAAIWRAAMGWRRHRSKRHGYEPPE